MKLYGKIYLVLALTTLLTLMLSSWIAFSFMPAEFERQRVERLESFNQAAMSLQNPTRSEVETLADSMEIGLRFLRNSQHPQGAPQGGPPFPPEEMEWRGVQVIHFPESDFSVVATARMRNLRLFPLMLLTLGLFFSQALALALGLRPVFRRISTLDRVTGEFGKGTLTARYPISRGGDEIEKLGSSFNEMAEKIISLLDSHNELLSTVAHELRTPMARLSFALELAKENPQTVKEKLGLMERDLFELDRLVSELLEFNRIGSTGSAVREEVSLDSICRAAADGEKIPDSEIKIVISSNEADSIVSGDYRLLLRALSNLIRNAVKYAATTVYVTVIPLKNRVEVSVEDDGKGFARGFTERAVSPFVKGHESTGSGLGLAIVNRIAEKHRGSLSLSNGKDSGAKVLLSLPRKQD